MNLQNKVAVVTGAAGRLGRAVSFRLKECGANLVLVDKCPIEAAELSNGQGRHVICQVDILDSDRLHRAIADAVAPWGRIDVLWQFLMDLNARSLLNVAHAVVPYMLQQGSGRIITVGATAAERGRAFMGAYCASKSSLIRLTESMSAELMDKHVNVNCVLPSIIDTPDNRAAMQNADFMRWVAPDALADVVAFLCTDLARAVHGATIPVTGKVVA